MLEVRELLAGYGETQVIHGVDLAVREGQFHAILGRNGVGKTTTLKTIVGLLPAFGGVVLLGAAFMLLEPVRSALRPGGTAFAWTAGTGALLYAAYLGLGLRMTPRRLLARSTNA